VSIRNLASKFAGSVDPSEPQMIPTGGKKKFRLFSKS
jgi:hypothetical protein